MMGLKNLWVKSFEARHQKPVDTRSVKTLSRVAQEGRPLGAGEGPLRS